MRYLPYIAGSYGLTIALALVLGIGSALRLARVRTRFAAVEAARATRRP